MARAQSAGIVVSMGWRINGPKVAATASFMLLFFSFGYCSRTYKIFPHSLVMSAKEGFDELRTRFGVSRPTWQRDVVDKEKGKRALTNPIVVNEPGAYPGPTALNMFDPSGDYLKIRIIDLDGKLRHEWKLDWFSIWPDATHVPSSLRPQSKPGTMVHGFEILESGDLVFNFMKLGLIRMNPCGQVVWKLPELTHHSLHRDEDGTFWASSMHWYGDKDPPFPNHKKVFEEPTIIQVSEDGKVLREISLVDVLVKNGYAGLLYSSTTANWNATVTGDTVHLNDVEVYPKSKPEGFFQHGDIMVSLRNISSVVVFRPDTLKIKMIFQKDMVRQHDPDFIDGNTISVFDNNGVVTDAKWRVDKTHGGSRIVTMSATGENTIRYKSDDFYGEVQGKHQVLPNGNVLVSDTVNGRGFEVDTAGKIVWEYLHMAKPGLSARMDEVQRIPESIAATVAQRAASGCKN